MKRELRKRDSLRKDLFFTRGSSTGTAGGGDQGLVQDRRVGSFYALYCFSIFIISPCDFCTALSAVDGKHDCEFVDIFESLEVAVVISCFWVVPPTMQVKSELRNPMNLAGSDVGLSIFRRKEGMPREL